MSVIAHQDGVEPAAEVAGDRADEQPDRRQDAPTSTTIRERDARAVDDARQDVAAELVGAEPVRGATAAAAGRVRILGVGRPARRARREAPRAAAAPTTITRPTIASGLRRKRAASWIDAAEARLRAPPAAHRVSSHWRSDCRLRPRPSSRPRIEHAVEQVRQQVERHDDIAPTTIVPPSTAFMSASAASWYVEADARPGEDRLGQHRAFEQRA